MCRGDGTAPGSDGLAGHALSGCQRSEETGFDALLRTGASKYAQHKEEPVIRHFFRDRRDGGVLDVGCYQWRELSTT